MPRDVIVREKVEVSQIGWAKAHRTMGKDTRKTLRTIIWYKHACTSNQRDNFLSPSEPLKTDVNKNVVIERVSNEKTLF